jgi:hypothetical protein
MADFWGRKAGRYQRIAIPSSNCFACLLVA